MTYEYFLIVDLICEIYIYLNTHNHKCMTHIIINMNNMTHSQICILTVSIINVFYLNL